MKPKSTAIPIPYWESLLTSWSVLGTIQEGAIESPPEFLRAQSPYAGGIRKFTQAIVEVLGGGPNEPLVGALKLERMQKELDSSDLVLSWVGKNPKMEPEKAGILRTAEALGKWAAVQSRSALYLPEKAACNLLSTTCALVMDSFQGHPVTMSNAFSHRALQKALRTFSSAVLEEAGGQ